MAALDVTAKERFDELDKNRGTTLDRAVLCATVTIPYIFMEEGSSSQDDLSRGYAQGYGAKLVNHLVGKFALSILPPSQPFYRLSATNEAMAALSEGDEDKKFEIERILAEKEDGILRYINKSRFRKSLYPALRIAMVTGDSIIEKLEENIYRVLNLRNYVIKRDSAGNILDLIVKEVLDYDAVPDDIRATIDEDKRDEQVELYTRVYLEDKVYKKYQEIEGTTVSGSEVDLKKLSDSYISIRWNAVDGEDYGRSFVEEHLGTFIALEKQMKVINESSATASKTVFLVNPNGMTRYKDFVEATNGKAIIGHESDITTVKVNKNNDLQASLQIVQDYKRELAEAFLMGSASIRDAERVTAHEVQLVASELEASFGGIYTAIAENIQLPLVEDAMKTLKIDGGDDIDIIITAGVEALGRNVELNKINSLIQNLGILSGLVGQEEVARKINVSSMLSAIVSNSGVANKDFLLPETTATNNDLARKESALVDKSIDSVGKQAGSLV